MGAETSFVDLRRLAEWFATHPTRPSLHIEKIVERLGAIGVPLLGRELCSAQPQRRDAARTALALLANLRRDVRPRVIAELRAITDGEAPDAGKVCALGLLGELGERGAARFNDPETIQRTSAINLASQLETAADVASAADLMVGKLSSDDMVSLLSIMAQAAPDRAHRLATELCARLDLSADQRERVAEVALLHQTPAAPASATKRPPRPTHVTVLVDSAARCVVVATRKISGERRWRRWAVLIAGNGAIEDCIHEDHTGGDGDAAGLIANLCADGYRVASHELERARSLVALAARGDAERLPSPYYLGRDLLDLGEAHLSHARVNPTSATLGRAVELIADGDLPRARLLLARCEANADVEAANAACLLAQDRVAEAATCLGRAIEAEPSWPMHHWNLAAALYRLGDRAGCHAALVRFVATSSEPTGLFGDPDQPARVGQASRMMAEIERTARLSGIRLTPKKRRRKDQLNS